MNELIPAADSEPSASLSSPSAPTFNYVLALAGRASSEHTHKAYFRWTDEYLTATTGVKSAVGLKRLHRMSNLPVPLLQRSLSPAQLRAWLGQLANEGHSKQGLGQARAAITTLASLLAEAGWLDDSISASISNVRIPKAPDKLRTGRWLSPEQLHELMDAARRIATSENQMLRNDLIMIMLCTMGLRRDELATARWGDLSTQNNRPVLKVRGKGKKIASIDIPRPVLRAVDRWRIAVAPSALRPDDHLPLVCRLWKGGRLSYRPLTPEAIWLIITSAAREANLGHVAPHDLRRSVAGALQESGVSIEKISRLLRHSNVGVTERYLSKLPQRNEGAILMSDVLGLSEQDV